MALGVTGLGVLCEGDAPDDTFFAIYQPKLKLRVDGAWKISVERALGCTRFARAPHLYRQP